MGLKQIRETAGDVGKVGANGANHPMLAPGA